MATRWEDRSAPMEPIRTTKLESIRTDDDPLGLKRLAESLGEIEPPEPPQLDTARETIDKKAGRAQRSGAARTDIAAPDLADAPRRPGAFRPEIVRFVSLVRHAALELSRPLSVVTRRAGRVPCRREQPSRFTRPITSRRRVLRQASARSLWTRPWRKPSRRAIRLPIWEGAQRVVREGERSVPMM
jgi:hypothetical protein